MPYIYLRCGGSPRIVTFIDRELNRFLGPGGGVKSNGINRDRLFRWKGGGL